MVSDVSDHSSESPLETCCCRSCWHCYGKKQRKNESKSREHSDTDDVSKAQNMLLSIIYLLCVISTGTALVLTFWVDLLPGHWIHLAVIAYAGPAIAGLGYFLARKRPSREYKVDQSHHVVYRTFIIALIPSSLAYISLNITRFVLSFEVNKRFSDIVLASSIVLYAVLQSLFILKYAKRGVKEGVCMRLFLCHVMGTNVFLWLHEFSVHSLHSLEFLGHQWTQKSLLLAPRTVWFIETVEPYIYPLVIQFLLIASGALFQIWIDIGSMDPNVVDIYIDDDYDTQDTAVDNVFVFPVPQGPEARSSTSSSGDTSNLQCHWITCGFVLGILAFCALIGLALLVMTNSFPMHFNLQTYNFYQLCLYGLMVIATYVSLYYLHTHQGAGREIGALEVMLLLSMLGYMLFTEFSLVATLDDLNTHEEGQMLVLSILRLLHTAGQTLAILRGLRYQRRKSFGQSFSHCPSDSLLFLAFCNGALWVVESIFDLRLPVATPIQNDHYGSEMWRAIRFCLFPLCTLYRLLSCIALVEILIFN